MWTKLLLSSTQSTYFLYGYQAFVLIVFLAGTNHCHFTSFRASVLKPTKVCRIIMMLEVKRHLTFSFSHVLVMNKTNSGGILVNDTLMHLVKNAMWHTNDVSSTNIDCNILNSKKPHFPSVVLALVVWVRITVTSLSRPLLMSVLQWCDRLPWKA